MPRSLLAALWVATCLGCNPPSDSGSGNASGRGVILLRYAVGSESTEQRENGFLDTMKKEFPDIPLISTDQYAEDTATRALEKSKPLLLRFSQRTDAIFAVNESASVGMLQALTERELTGKIKFIGFDSGPDLIHALEEGKLQGLVLQNPVQIGYQSVKAMVDHLEGKEVPKRIPTGEKVATPENMKDAEIVALLKPEQFSESSESSGEKKKYQVAMIPKGTTHEFWKSVHAGAQKSAQELGNVEVLWKGPLTEGKSEDQISLVRSFIAKKVHGICLAPSDSRALVGVVQEAKNAAIPVVIFDSGLADPDLTVSYVATDNYNGGALAARRLAEVLKAKK